MFLIASFKGVSKYKFTNKRSETGVIICSGAFACRSQINSTLICYTSHRFREGIFGNPKPKFLVQAKNNILLVCNVDHNQILGNSLVWNLRDLQITARVAIEVWVNIFALYLDIFFSILSWIKTRVLMF